MIGVELTLYNYNLTILKDKATNFILSCQSYDYGFGMNPGLESHCGCGYCAIASLGLMNKLSVLDNCKENVIDYFLKKQNIGFHVFFFFIVIFFYT